MHQYQREVILGVEFGLQKSILYHFLLQTGEPRVLKIESVVVSIVYKVELNLTFFLNYTSFVVAFG